MTNFYLDMFMMYQFIKRLSIPFEQTDAFKHGIIDKDGKTLRKFNTLQTKEERDSFRLYDRLIFNLKKIIAKVPGGKSKIATYAAALFLIKEHSNPNSIVADSPSLLENEIFTIMEDLLLNDRQAFIILEESMKPFIEEDAPTNSVGSGAIAGTNSSDSISRMTKKPLKHKKDIQELAVVLPKLSDTHGIARKHMPQIASKDYPTFLSFLTDKGVKYHHEQLPANILKATQAEFSPQGVEKAIIKDLQGEKKAIIVSSDFYILDGHHRWLSYMNTRPNKAIDVIRVTNMKIKTLLQLTLEFPKVTFKDINNIMNVYRDV